MARYTHARNAFSFGEVSPASFGRADLEQYRQMCEKIQNMIPMIGGGATKRLGTVRVGNNAAIGDGPWLDVDINDESYLKLVPVSDSSDGGRFLVLTEDVIKIFTTNINALNHANGAAVGTTTSGGTYGILNEWSILTPNTGWPSGLEEWAQFGDLLVIVNGAYPPLVVYRDSVTATYKYFIWGKGELLADLSLDTTQGHRLFPYDTENATAVTMTINTASVGTGRTLTASAATFSAGMVGRRIRVRNGSDIGVALITAYTSSTVVTVTVERAFPGTAGYTAWSFAQWGGDRGWPKTVSFFEERIIFGSNTAFPDKMWASQLGDLYEMSNPDPTASLTLSDAFAVSIGQSETAEINALYPKENLFALTKLKETYLDSIDDQLAIGFGNTRAKNNSRYGADRQQPSGLGEAMVFVQAGRRKILELVFNLRERGYEVEDLSLFTPTIFRDRARFDYGITQSLSSIRDDMAPGFRALTYTATPMPILWCIDSSGRLYSITRKRGTFETMAWAHHVIGGEIVGPDGETIDAQVMDICATKGLGATDLLILAVRREVNGTERTCLEFIHPDFLANELYDADYVDVNGSEKPVARSLPIYLDYASYQFSEAGATVFNNFDHLIDQEVHVMADGIYEGTMTVDGSGQLTFATTKHLVIAGFSYEAELVPSALESNSLFGSGLGQIKRTEEVTVLFERTVAASIGVVGRESEEIDVQFRESSIPANEPIPLFTGEKTIKINASYEKRQNIYVRQEEPYPMTVNAIISKGILYD